MLVLSRKKNESIMIGDDVVINVVEIRGDKVRLGIEAPGSVPVHRQEVYEVIKRNENSVNNQPCSIGGCTRKAEWSGSVDGRPAVACTQHKDDLD